MLRDVVRIYENRTCSRSCQNKKNLAMITDGFAFLQKEPKNTIFSSILGE